MADGGYTATKAAFVKADTNGDGLIDQTEMIRVFKTVLPDFTQADLIDLFNAADTDGDGKLNYDEFLEWIWGVGGMDGAAQKLVQEKIDAELIVYAREGCGCCSQFVDQCDAAGITYRKMDCDNPDVNTEMWEKAMPTDWFKACGGSVGLPIVDAYGNCIMRPSLDDINRLSPFAGDQVQKPEVQVDKPGGSKGTCVGELVVYGREECGCCKSFKSKCDEAGIKYREVSCDTQKGSKEMWDRAKQTQWYKDSGGSIGLPIVDVYGTCLMRPSIEEVQKIKDACCNVQETLSAHNCLRLVHGAPELKWSDECAEYAKRCARENSDNGRMKHCMLETDDGGRKMGQNIYWCSAPSAEKSAINAWYDEIRDPGYNFESSTHSEGTGHFTQVVWYNSTHVGMSKSPCGCYIVANYYPAGNFAGVFPNNVLPPDTPLEFKPRNKKEKQLFDMFEELDILQDGMADLAELEEFFSNAGETKLAAACGSLAADADGFVDVKSFVMGMVDVSQSDESLIDKNLPRCVGFVKFDENGDGRLSKEEFLRFMTANSPLQISPEKGDALFEEFDADGSGDIDYQELNAMLDSGKLFAGGGGGPRMIETWTDDLDAWLADVPFVDYVEKLKQHVNGGGTAEVDKGDTYLKCKLIMPGGSSSFAGSWG